MRTAAAALVVAALACLTGCSGSGSTTARQIPAGTPSTAAHPGGFIGAIDAARLAAVCANARQAQEMLQPGLSTQPADQALAAILGLLRRPPVDPAVQALAVPVQREVTAGQRARAVATVLAFCTRSRA